MRVPGPAEEFVVRLDEVRSRMATLVETPVPDTLTEPHPSTGERWAWNQVWAHMVEFVPYWMDQIRRTVENEGESPPPFGRVQTDPGRLAGIESGRLEGVPALWERLSGEIDDLKVFLTDLAEEAWRRQGEHQTLGVMGMDRIVDEFLVGHLEEHADQLEGLAGHAPPGDTPTR
ncbi:MAG: hypothetical protein ABR518_00090 [Actinomycetota bacterium]